MLLCPDGGIGRHKRLKISRLDGCAGSSPAPGTKCLLEVLSLSVKVEETW